MYPKVKDGFGNENLYSHLCVPKIITSPPEILIKCNIYTYTTGISVTKLDDSNYIASTNIGGKFLTWQRISDVPNLKITLGKYLMNLHNFHMYRF